MEEKLSTLKEINSDVSQAIDRVKAGVDELVGDFDFREVTQKIESFGRTNPAALAIASLTIGIAAGLLVKKTTSRA
jgi:hypothetical protein